MENNITQKEALEMLKQMDISAVPQNLVFYSQEGDENKVALLLKGGVNPNFPTEPDKNKKIFYASHQAASKGKLGVLKLLLENGCDINLKDKEGYTSLMHAIFSNQIEVVKYLISAGANLNLRANDNFNALHYAKYNKKEEIVQLLRDAKAEEMSETEIKKAISKNVMAVVKKVAIGAIVVIAIMFFYNKGSKTSSSSSGSSSSSSSGTHTCGQCGSSFSGNGWATIGGEQYEPKSWLGYGYCSKKCAYDSQPNRWKH